MRIRTAAAALALLGAAGSGCAGQAPDADDVRRLYMRAPWEAEQQAPARERSREELQELAILLHKAGAALLPDSAPGR